MALRYRIMVMAYGRMRSAGHPDYTEHEAAADQRRILGADGRMYSIQTIDVPTGTTPAQDLMVRLVRDVRYRQRQHDAAESANRRKAMHYRLQPLMRRLDHHLQALQARMGTLGDGWQPHDTRFYEFYVTVRRWMLRQATMAQAHRVIGKAADHLVPPDTLPVTPDDMAAMERQQAEDARLIDDFIHTYDAMDPQCGPRQTGIKKT